jgi:hypothetical protein
MMKSISKVVGVIGLCAGALGLAGEAKAWLPVAIPGTYGVFGASVTDHFFADSVKARAEKLAAPQRAFLDIQTNTGTYLSSLSLFCTTGNATQNKTGTSNVDGDILLTCPSGGLFLTGGGAIQSL